MSIKNMHICVASPFYRDPPLVIPPKCYCKSRRGREMRFTKMRTEMDEKFYNIHAKGAVWLCTNCGKEMSWDDNMNREENGERQSAYWIGMFELWEAEFGERPPLELFINSLVL